MAAQAQVPMAVRVVQSEAVSVPVDAVGRGASAVRAVYPKGAVVPAEQAAHPVLVVVMVTRAPAAEDKMAATGQMG